MKHTVTMFAATYTKAKSRTYRDRILKSHSSRDIAVVAAIKRVASSQLGSRISAGWSFFGAFAFPNLAIDTATF
jgi:hypothetical protein